MVWTGSEAVVWGGVASSRTHSIFEGRLPRNGGAYDPAHDRWRTVPNAPIVGRSRPVIAWTGHEVVVFGGSRNDRPQLDGAAWDPATNRWRTISTSPLSGSEPVGGLVDGRLLVVTSTAAAAYDPAEDRWESLPAAPIRAGWRTAVVAGARLVVIAFGDGATPPVDWAVWDAVAERWTHGQVPIDPTMAGTVVMSTADLVALESGLTFDPLTSTWSSGPGCAGAGAGWVWTGSWILGVTEAWSPGDRDCRDLPPAPRRDAPFDDTNGREFPVGVWTGRQYVTWSGGTGADIAWAPKDGALFTPENDLGPCCG